MHLIPKNGVETLLHCEVPGADEQIKAYNPKKGVETLLHCEVPGADEDFWKGGSKPQRGIRLPHIYLTFLQSSYEF